MVNQSQYKNQFANWGAADKPLVEKTPQYPFYSLPFRGSSEYKLRYASEDGSSETHKKKSRAKRPSTAQATKQVTAEDVKIKQ